MKSGSNGRPANPVATAASNRKSSGISPFPDTVAERQIGRELQALYDKIVAEPLPDQLVDLLRKLSADPDKKS
jgi:hypothetical protein